MLEATADPTVFIEARGGDWTRYRRTTDGRRWEVHGACDRRGDCLVGAYIAKEGRVMRDKKDVEATSLKYALSGRLDAEEDVPVTPEFRGCCPFSFVELEPLAP